MRKLVEIEVADITDRLEGGLDTCIELLQDILFEHPDARIAYKTGYDDEMLVLVVSDKEEDDYQYNVRLVYEARAAEICREAELRELKRLQDKYREEPYPKIPLEKIYDH